MPRDNRNIQSVAQQMYKTVKRHRGKEEKKQRGREAVNKLFSQCIHPACMDEDDDMGECLSFFPPPGWLGPLVQ